MPIEPTGDDKVMDLKCDCGSFRPKILLMNTVYFITFIVPLCLIAVYTNFGYENLCGGLVNYTWIYLINGILTVVSSLLRFIIYNVYIRCYSDKTESFILYSTIVYVILLVLSLVFVAIGYVFILGNCVSNDLKNNMIVMLVFNTLNLGIIMAVNVYDYVVKKC